MFPEFRCPKLGVCATNSKKSESIIHKKIFPEFRCPKLGVCVIHECVLYTHNYGKWLPFIKSIWPMFNYQVRTNIMLLNHAKDICRFQVNISLKIWPFTSKPNPREHLIPSLLIFDTYLWINRSFFFKL